jgi:DNA-binding transcriptional ArsR family regulator
MVSVNKSRSRAPKGKRASGKKGDRRAASSRKSVSKARKPQAEISDRTIKQQFTGLKSSDGCGAVVVVAEQGGKQWEIVKGGVEINTAIGGGGTKSGLKRNGSGLHRVSEAFAALGHPQRIRILVKLLGSPGTYQALMKLTKLGAGPLYHHINQLRMAGLILPKQRDLYELTRGGRNVILTALALEPLMRDKRRRPLAGEN